MTRKIHGKIHGKTIELDEDPGLTGGQEVEITLDVAPIAKVWGEGILRTAGALRTTLTGMRSWRRFTRIANGIAVPNWRMSDPPLGHQYLLGPYAASRRTGPSILPARRRSEHRDCRPGRALRGSL